MTVQLGRYGIWARAPDLTTAIAVGLEELGYGAIWVGGSPPADLSTVEGFLAATERIVVATGIVNMWAAPAAEVATSYARIVDAHPGRFLLGVGIGHPEATDDYRSPYATIVSYLDELDAHGVPAEGRVLAALGPRVLALAAERTAGAHPYLTTPEHTRQARALIGPGPLLAPEQKVVLETDAEAARALGRPAVRSPYLGLVNYRRNLLRLGFTEEQLDTAADEVVDALVARGDAATAAAGLTAHLDAGADHVCARLLAPPGADPMPGYGDLARALGLT
jgi:probable F420-dependent oxidoreductase